MSTTTFLVSLVLLLAGITAGLIQYFVDFKGLPIYQPPAQDNRDITSQTGADFWTRLLNFFKQNWQLLGYIIIGIAGAFLIPMIAKLAKLPAIKFDFSCLGEPACPSNGWDLLVLFGYGIISGYSSVRLIRSVGNVLIGNASRFFQDQQQLMTALKKQLDDLKAIQTTVLSTEQYPGPTQQNHAFAKLPQQAPPYFDQTRNESDKKFYYKGMDLGNNRELFSRLHELIKNTHIRKLDYKPAIYLYPAVDLHPNRKLKSIYSGKEFNVRTLVAMDRQIDALRQMELERFDALQEISMEHFMETLEERFPYNCEHVVPQSWFNKNQPMRGDLHHLFACEVRCNSYRGNHPYYEFQGFGTDSSVQLDMANCGRAKVVNNIIGFEPEINKGTVARATLYFLLRYPGVINEKGYKASDIPMLLSWHKQHAVTEYEKHRNQYIYNIQKNRNPFIDHVDIAERVDFDTAFNTIGFIDSNYSASPDDGAAAEEVTEMGSAALAGCIPNTNAKPWKDWRTAEALRSLLRKVNHLAPHRRKQSDGTIGDTAHQSRKSDHNPGIWDETTKKGVVTALDVTHDPVRNCNCEVLAKSLQANKDVRIKYVIWNKQIMSSDILNGVEAWTWKPYTGTNLHDKHIHVSVKCRKELYDNDQNWTIQSS